MSINGQVLGKAPRKLFSDLDYEYSTYNYAKFKNVVRDAIMDKLKDENLEACVKLNKVKS